MKEKVTFKMFFSTIWRGIVQVFQWILHILGLRDDSKYALFLKRVMGTALAIWAAFITCALLYEILEDPIDTFWARNIKKEYDTQKMLSPYVSYQECWGDPCGRIYNEQTGKVTLKRVDWVLTSDDNDSLAVYSKDGKRGYLNRFTGEVVIREQYDKAWVFSEGLAAVVKDCELFFIDHKGNIVLQDNWVAEYGNDYVFKDGFCPITSNETCQEGLIDKKGEWQILPEYDNISEYEGFWRVINNGLEKVLASDFTPLLPGSYEYIWFYAEDEIMVQQIGAPKQVYDYSGNLVNDCVISAIYPLWYTIGKKNNPYEEEDGCYEIVQMATCDKYEVSFGDYSEHFGLIDKNGKRITEPIFNHIEAIGKDLYLCSPQGIIIDSKGRVVE